MNRRFGTYLAAALVMLTSAAPACAGNLSVDGYLKNYSSVYTFPNYTLASYLLNPPPIGAVSNRLRLTSRWQVTRWLMANVAYDLESRIQDKALFGQNLTAGAVGQPYRVGDLDQRLYPAPDDPVSSFGLFENLDRAQLDLRLGQLDLYVGRQAIAWGVARVINPTDILAPFSYATLDTEDRIGVDAVRARLPIGFMGELDMGLVAGDNFKSKNSAAYVRYKTYIARTDLTGIVAAFREHLMLGFDMTRAIGGAGSWLEVAYVRPKLFQPNAALRPDGYWRLSLGADYNFAANTYAFVEYHYNQPGASHPADYLRLLSNPAYVDGAVYLLGEHYLTPGVRRELTPLLTATSNLLWNLSDGSAYLSASLDYNLSENVYLAAGAYLGIGPGPDGIARLKSEFGSYPNQYYTSFRYYF